MLPYIFVGCSSEAAEHVASAIQAELARTANLQIWNQDFFPPGGYVLDTLAEKASRFDFAILIFAADDVLESRGNRYLAVRDNTVLEAGFFLAHLGRKRTFIVTPNEPSLKLPSDLLGLTRVAYPKELRVDLIRAELGPACTQMRNRINELGKRDGVESKLSEGMIAAMGLIESRSTVDLHDLSEFLAGLNQGSEPDCLAWRKAAQYLILYLVEAGLVEYTVGSSVRLKLSKAGTELANSDSFKGRLSGILGSDRGALVVRLFDR